MCAADVVPSKLEPKQTEIKLTGNYLVDSLFQNAEELYNKYYPHELEMLQIAKQYYETVIAAIYQINYEITKRCSEQIFAINKVLGPRAHYETVLKSNERGTSGGLDMAENLAQTLNTTSEKVGDQDYELHKLAQETEESWKIAHTVEKKETEIPFADPPFAYILQTRGQQDAAAQAAIQDFTFGVTELLKSDGDVKKAISAFTKAREYYSYSSFGLTYWFGHPYLTAEQVIEAQETCDLWLRKCQAKLAASQLKEVREEKVSGATIAAKSPELLEEAKKALSGLQGKWSLQVRTGTAAEDFKFTPYDPQKEQKGQLCLCAEVIKTSRAPDTFETHHGYNKYITDPNPVDSLNDTLRQYKQQLLMSVQEKILAYDPYSSIKDKMSVRYSSFTCFFPVQENTLQEIAELPFLISQQKREASKNWQTKKEEQMSKQLAAQHQKARLYLIRALNYLKINDFNSAKEILESTAAKTIFDESFFPWVKANAHSQQINSVISSLIKAFQASKFEASKLNKDDTTSSYVDDKDVLSIATAIEKLHIKECDDICQEMREKVKKELQREKELKQFCTENQTKIDAALVALNAFRDTKELTMEITQNSFYYSHHPTEKELIAQKHFKIMYMLPPDQFFDQYQHGAVMCIVGELYNPDRRKNSFADEKELEAICLKKMGIRVNPEIVQNFTAVDGWVRCVLPVNAATLPQIAKIPMMYAAYKIEATNDSPTIESIKKFNAAIDAEEKKASPETLFDNALQKLTTAPFFEIQQQDFAKIKKIRPRDTKLQNICTDILMLEAMQADFKDIGTKLRELKALNADGKLAYVDAKGEVTDDPTKGELSFCVVPPEKSTEFDATTTTVLNGFETLKIKGKKLYAFSLKDNMVAGFIKELDIFSEQQYLEKKQLPAEQFRLALRNLAVSYEVRAELKTEEAKTSAEQEEEVKAKQEEAKDKETKLQKATTAFKAIQDSESKTAEIVKIRADIALLGDFAEIKKVSENLSTLGWNVSWKLDYIDKDGKPTADPQEGTLSFCIVPRGRGRSSIFASDLVKKFDAVGAKKTHDGKIYFVPLTSLRQLNTSLAPQVEKRVAEQPENRFRVALDKLQGGDAKGAEEDFAKIYQSKATHGLQLQINKNIGLARSASEDLKVIADALKSKKLKVTCKLDYVSKGARSSKPFEGELSFCLLPEGGAGTVFDQDTIAELTQLGMKPDTAGNMYFMKLSDDLISLRNALTKTSCFELEHTK